MTSLLSKLWWRRYLRRNAAPGKSWTISPRCLRTGNRAIGPRLLDQVQYFGRRADALPEWREAAQIKIRQSCGKSGLLCRCYETDAAYAVRAIPDASQVRTRRPIDATGGSTGEPTRFFHDWPIASITAQVTYTMIRMGWQPGMPIVTVWGSERDIGKNVPKKVKLHYQLTRQYQVDGYSMTDSTTDRVLELIRRNKPVAMYGFTSMLEFVARQVHDRGLMVAPGSVRAAWNGGEMLSEEQAESFPQRLPCAFIQPLWRP